MKAAENFTETEVKDLLQECETLGTIGSPSSTTKLMMNIMGSAIDKKLLGELAIFKYSQDGKPHYTLGQITEVSLKNYLLEQSEMQSMAREIGTVNDVSGTQDVHIGSFSSSAVFCHNSESNVFEQSILGTVPSTGTAICKLSNQVLNKIFEKYNEQLFYLGHGYGSNTNIPMWFKHFGRGINGLGEAFHMGIFGSTGSGKSTLAHRILMAYSRYSEMGLLVLDPVGEFTTNMKQDASIKSEDSNINYKEILNSLGKLPITTHVRDLVLDDWNIFKQILKESAFFRILTVSGEKKAIAIELLVGKLKKKIGINELSSRNTFDLVMKILKDENNQKQIFYGKEPLNRLKNRLSAIGDEELHDIWSKISTPFENRPGAYTITELLEYFSRPSKPFVIIDLSNNSLHELKWSDAIQTLILNRILRGLSEMGEKSYHTRQSLNTLVVLDEAHRFAGKNNESDYNQDPHLERLKSKLIDYVNTTRKFGLGWMFISTSLSGIDKGILRQLKVLFFGVGLSLGSDYSMLQELIPEKSALDFYRSFNDPQSAFDLKTRKFPFMSKGPVSPLSFSGFPLFINSLSDDEFMSGNAFHRLPE
jgi:hypothetical protein